MRILLYIQDNLDKDGQWMPGHGVVPLSAPCFEVYLNDPAATEPEEHLTDIHAPIEHK